MHISMFGIVVCSLLVLASTSLGLHRRWSARRLLARRMEGEELVRRYPDLDRELDRVWQDR